MRLSLEKERTEKNYRIGYIAVIDEYVLAAGKAEQGKEVEDYFRISPEVYGLYQGSLGRLDQIAEGLKNNGERDQAFLFSSDMGKNNEKQKASFLSCEEIQNGYVQGTLTESDHKVEKSQIKKGLLFGSFDGNIQKLSKSK